MSKKNFGDRDKRSINSLDNISNDAQFSTKKKPTNKEELNEQMKLLSPNKERDVENNEKFWDIIKQEGENTREIENEMKNDIFESVQINGKMNLKFYPKYLRNPDHKELLKISAYRLLAEKLGLAITDFKTAPGGIQTIIHIINSNLLEKEMESFYKSLRGEEELGNKKEVTATKKESDPDAVKITKKINELLITNGGVTKANWESFQKEWGVLQVENQLKFLEFNENNYIVTGNYTTQYLYQTDKNNYYMIPALEYNASRFTYTYEEEEINGKTLIYLETIRGIKKLTRLTKNPNGSFSIAEKGILVCSGKESDPNGVFKESGDEKLISPKPKIETKIAPNLAPENPIKTEVKENDKKEVPLNHTTGDPKIAPNTKQRENKKPESDTKTDELLSKYLKNNEVEDKKYSEQFWSPIRGTFVEGITHDNMLNNLKEALTKSQNNIEIKMDIKNLKESEEHFMYQLPAYRIMLKNELGFDIISDFVLTKDGVKFNIKKIENAAKPKENKKDFTETWDIDELNKMPIEKVAFEYKNKLKTHYRYEDTALYNEAMSIIAGKREYIYDKNTSTIADKRYKRLTDYAMIELAAIQNELMDKGYAMRKMKYVIEQTTEALRWSLEPMNQEEVREHKEKKERFSNEKKENVEILPDNEPLETEKGKKEGKGTISFSNELLWNVLKELEIMDEGEDEDLKSLDYYGALKGFYEFLKKRENSLKNKQEKTEISRNKLSKICNIIGKLTDNITPDSEDFEDGTDIYGHLDSTKYANLIEIYNIYTKSPESKKEKSMSWLIAGERIIGVHTPTAEEKAAKDSKKKVEERRENRRLNKLAIWGGISSISMSLWSNLSKLYNNSLKYIMDYAIDKKAKWGDGYKKEKK